MTTISRREGDGARSRMLLTVCKPELPERVLGNQAVVASSIQLNVSTFDKRVADDGDLTAHLANLNCRLPDCRYWVKRRVQRDSPATRTADTHHTAPLSFPWAVQNGNSVAGLATRNFWFRGTILPCVPALVLPASIATQCQLLLTTIGGPTANRSDHPVVTAIVTTIQRAA